MGNHLGVVNPLSTRIRQLREQLGMTQSELAKACGRRSKSTVCHWESGTKAISSDLLPTLAHALGVTVGELYEPPLPVEESPAVAGEAA